MVSIVSEVGVGVIEVVNISIFLFLIGIWGLTVMRNNLLVMLMAVELLLFAVSLCFIGFSCHLDDLTGQVVALFVLSVAASESAIGLAVLIVYYRLRGVIMVDLVCNLKG